jgi:hypothetical protein
MKRSKFSERHPVGDVCRRLRQLEDENARLKRLVADLTLDKHMLSEALRKKRLYANWRPERIPPSAPVETPPDYSSSSSRVYGGTTPARRA